MYWVALGSVIWPAWVEKKPLVNDFESAPTAGLAAAVFDLNGHNFFN